MVTGSISQADEDRSVALHDDNGLSAFLCDTNAGHFFAHLTAGVPLEAVGVTRDDDDFYVSVRPRSGIEAIPVNLRSTEVPPALAPHAEFQDAGASALAYGEPMAQSISTSPYTDGSFTQNHSVAVLTRVPAEIASWSDYDGVSVQMVGGVFAGERTAYRIHNPSSLPGLVPASIQDARSSATAFVQRRNGDTFISSQGVSLVEVRYGLESWAVLNLFRDPSHTPSQIAEAFREQFWQVCSDRGDCVLPSVISVLQVIDTDALDRMGALNSDALLQAFLMHTDDGRCVHEVLAAHGLVATSIRREGQDFHIYVCPSMQLDATAVDVPIGASWAGGQISAIDETIAAGGRAETEPPRMTAAGNSAGAALQGEDGVMRGMQPMEIASSAQAGSLDERLAAHPDSGLIVVSPLGDGGSISPREVGRIPSNINTAYLVHDVRSLPGLDEETALRIHLIEPSFNHRRNGDTVISSQGDHFLEVTYGWSIWTIHNMFRIGQPPFFMTDVFVLQLRDLCAERGACILPFAVMVENVIDTDALDRMAGMDDAVRLLPAFLQHTDDGRFVGRMLETSGLVATDIARRGQAFLVFVQPHATVQASVINLGTGALAVSGGALTSSEYSAQAQPGTGIGNRMPPFRADANSSPSSFGQVIAVATSGHEVQGALGQQGDASSVPPSAVDVRAMRKQPSIASQDDAFETVDRREHASVEANVDRLKGQGYSAELIRELTSTEGATERLAAIVACHETLSDVLRCPRSMIVDIAMHVDGHRALRAIATHYETLTHSPGSSGEPNAAPGLGLSIAEILLIARVDEAHRGLHALVEHADALRELLTYSPADGRLTSLEIALLARHRRVGEAVAHYRESAAQNRELRWKRRRNFAPQPDRSGWPPVQSRTPHPLIESTSTLGRTPLAALPVHSPSTSSPRAPIVDRSELSRRLRVDRAVGDRLRLFHSVEGNTITSAAFSGRDYRGEFYPARWRLDGPLHNDNDYEEVVVRQYVEISRSRGFYGTLPRSVEIRNVSNERLPETQEIVRRTLSRFGLEPACPRVDAAVGTLTVEIQRCEEALPHVTTEHPSSVESLTCPTSPDVEAIPGGASETTGTSGLALSVRGTAEQSIPRRIPTTTIELVMSPEPRQAMSPEPGQGVTTDSRIASGRANWSIEPAIAYARSRVDEMTRAIRRRRPRVGQQSAADQNDTSAAVARAGLARFSYTDGDLTYIAKCYAEWGGYARALHDHEHLREVFARADYPARLVLQVLREQKNPGAVRAITRFHEELTRLKYPIDGIVRMACCGHHPTINMQTVVRHHGALTNAPEPKAGSAEEPGLGLSIAQVIDIASQNTSYRSINILVAYRTELIGLLTGRGGRQHVYASDIVEQFKQSLEAGEKLPRLGQLEIYRLVRAQGGTKKLSELVSIYRQAVARDAAQADGRPVQSGMELGESTPVAYRAATNDECRALSDGLQEAAGRVLSAAVSGDAAPPLSAAARLKQKGYTDDQLKLLENRYFLRGGYEQALSDHDEMHEKFGYPEELVHTLLSQQTNTEGVSAVRQFHHALFRGGKGYRRDQIVAAATHRRPERNLGAIAKHYSKLTNPPKPAQGSNQQPGLGLSAEEVLSIGGNNAGADRIQTLVDHLDELRSLMLRRGGLTQTEIVCLVNFGNWEARIRDALDRYRNAPVQQENSGRSRVAAVSAASPQVMVIDESSDDDAPLQASDTRILHVREESGPSEEQAQPGRPDARKKLSEAGYSKDDIKQLESTYASGQGLDQALRDHEQLCDQLGYVPALAIRILCEAKSQKALDAVRRHHHTLRNADFPHSAIVDMAVRGQPVRNLGAVAKHYRELMNPPEPAPGSNAPPGLGLSVEDVAFIGAAGGAAARIGDLVRHVDELRALLLTEDVELRLTQEKIMAMANHQRWGDEIRVTVERYRNTQAVLAQDDDRSQPRTGKNPSLEMIAIDVPPPQAGQAVSDPRRTLLRDYTEVEVFGLERTYDWNGGLGAALSDHEFLRELGYSAGLVRKLLCEERSLEGVSAIRQFHHTLENLGYPHSAIVNMAVRSGALWNIQAVVDYHPQLTNPMQPAPGSGQEPGLGLSAEQVASIGGNGGVVNRISALTTHVDGLRELLLTNDARHRLTHRDLVRLANHPESSVKIPQSIENYRRARAAALESNAQLVPGAVEIGSSHEADTVERGQQASNIQESASVALPKGVHASSSSAPTGGPRTVVEISSGAGIVSAETHATHTAANVRDVITIDDSSDDEAPLQVGDIRRRQVVVPAPGPSQEHAQAALSDPRVGLSKAGYSDSEIERLEENYASRRRLNRALQDHLDLCGEFHYAPALARKLLCESRSQDGLSAVWRYHRVLRNAGFAHSAIVDMAIQSEPMHNLGAVSEYYPQLMYSPQPVRGSGRRPGLGLTVAQVVSIVRSDTAANRIYALVGHLDELRGLLTTEDTGPSLTQTDIVEMASHPEWEAKIRDAAEFYRSTRAALDQDNDESAPTRVSNPSVEMVVLDDASLDGAPPQVRGAFVEEGAVRPSAQTQAQPATPDSRQALLNEGYSLADVQKLERSYSWRKGLAGALSDHEALRDMGYSSELARRLLCEARGQETLPAIRQHHEALRNLDYPHSRIVDMAVRGAPLLNIQAVLDNHSQLTNPLQPAPGSGRKPGLGLSLKDVASIGPNFAAADRIDELVTRLDDLRELLLTRDPRHRLTHEDLLALANHSQWRGRIRETVELYRRRYPMVGQNNAQ
jgi:hypothetical protein